MHGVSSGRIIVVHEKMGKSCKNFMDSDGYSNLYRRKYGIVAYIKQEESGNHQ